jgi:hypothetical protein
MNSIDLRNKLGGFILALAVMPGIAIVGSATAQAQDQARHDQGQRNGNWQREGRRNRDRTDRDDQNRSRNRDDRYRGRHRDDRYRQQDDRYRQTQRRGNSGYGNRGYGNNGYGNGSQIAARQGFQDGLNTGSSDASRGQSYNPQRSHFYKNGNGGYGGDQQAYRNGFLQGYQEGYQRNGGNGRGGNNRGRTGLQLPW